MRTVHFCVLILLGAAPAAAQISDNEVRIGVLTDLSGLYSDVAGKTSVAAAELAIEDFTREKKPKFKVKLLVADHQNKADIASTKAREWFDRDGVDLITDLVNSACALAVSKIAAEKNRVVIVTTSGSSRLTNEDCSPTTAHWAFDSYSLATSLATAAVKTGADTWFMLTADYAFGQSMEKDATAAIIANGGKVLGSVRHPLNASDFSSFLLQAQASKAKVVGLANAGGDTINAIKAATDFGINKTQTVAPFLLFLSDVHSLGLPTAKGMLVTAAFYWNQDAAARAWSKRIYAKVKRMPDMSNAAVYSGTMAYLNAVAALDTDEAKAVMAKMRATPVNDLFTKNARLREDGLLQHDMHVYRVKTPEASKEPWDYYEYKTTIPGSIAFQSLAQSRCPLIKK